MKNVYPALAYRLCKTLIPAVLAILPITAFSQRPITSIATSGSVNTPVVHSNIKGAGLRNPSNNSLISTWDSTGTNYIVNFNAPAAYNSLTLTQFNVQGFGTPVIKMPVSAVIKIRRATNPDVGDTRNYFNFWAQYSTAPTGGLGVGVFNFTAPEVLIPEDAFVTNNLTSGYDNIFQNTIANPHFGNIERVDFIIPAGLSASHDTDLVQSGVTVIDRGTGDPFKVAAILAVDANNNPTLYGPLVSVTAADFGGNLLPSAINYGILINDVNFYSQSRPSTLSTQNLRGVFIGLDALGLSLNQDFFGYSLFGPDVITANPDWTTYPNNTASNSQLDPVNVMGMFKSTKSVLAVPLSFYANKSSQTARLNFILYNRTSAEKVIIERSSNNREFRLIGELEVFTTGNFRYVDASPYMGENYYRLKLVDKDKTYGYSETRLLRFDIEEKIRTYPNPTIDRINLDIPVSWQQKDLKVELWSAAGQLVHEENISIADKNETIRLKKALPGIYQLRLMQGEQIQTQTIFIIK